MLYGFHRRLASRKAIFVCAMVLGVGFAAPLFGQEENPPDAGDDEAEDGRGAARPAVEEIVVTAQRREENIQDVPISISVFNQQQINDRNIVNANDLATFTPSLTANPRFGDDNTTFAIRGFTQELRTTPSVGVYFADVVAPRGGGSITAGDGAGPGSFFDLQNVQVLKGPQGTLFGRNTTGGAVLLVPVKPTHEWEGYLEGSVGNYDMLRAQGVINAPLHDRVRLRVGVDRQVRDGYLNNTSDVGPSDLSDVNYWSVRASMVLDLMDNLENYSIFSFTDSENNGGITQVFACNTEGVGSSDPTALLVDVFAPACDDQLSRYGSGFYDVQNAVPRPKSEISQVQFINTTTWELTDYLTVKNIFSYAELETTLRTGVFGTDFQVATPSGDLPLFFSTSTQVPGVPTTSQRSIVEELQLQGNAFAERLQWQGGFYFERSEPDGVSGSQSANFISCDLDSLGLDPDGFRCDNATGLPLASVSRSLGSVTFENKAVYAQATFDVLADWLSLTGGFRYTWDETDGKSDQRAFSFPTTTDGSYTGPTGGRCLADSATYPDCEIKLSQNSDAPTWLIGVESRPIDDVMVYAKWVRGYRQGSVNIFGVEALNTYGPEKVDTYEIGTKTTFDGPIPGSFNFAAFYNDFRDQQIQVGVISSALVPTTAIANAGSSRIWGFEAEANVQPFEDVNLNVAYTYLDTKLEKLRLPERPPTVLAFIPSAAEGDPLSYSPKNQLAATLSYLVPYLPDSAGDLTLSATFIYNDNQRAATPSASPYATIPHYELVNLNVNWLRIADLPVDGSFFVTNLLGEEYWTYINGTYNSTGFETRSVGQPRMFGARLRYNFSL